MAFSSFGNPGNASMGSAASPGGVTQGPELELIQTEVLGFKSIAGDAKLQLTSPWSTPPTDTASLLAIAAHKGLVAAASPDSIIIATTDSVRKAFDGEKQSDSDVRLFEPQLKLPLSMRVSQLAFTADETYLILSAESGGGLAVYEVQSLLQGNTQTVFELSTNGETLRALVPNPTPEKAELCAIVTTNGSLHMANLKERQISNALKTQVSCISWKGEAKAEIPKPPSVSNAHVASLTWLENHVLLVIHTNATETPPSSTYHIISRQPPSTYTFQKLTDPVDPFGADKAPHHSILRLKDFPPDLQDLLIVSSTASPDIGLLSRSKKALSPDKPAEAITNVFTTTELLDDSKRAQLPMSESLDNTVPIGVSLDLSSKEKVYKPLPADEEIEDSPGPLPGYWVLNNEGVLCSWWVVYEDSIRQGTSYPGIGTGETPVTMASSAPVSAPAATVVPPAFGNTSTTPSAFGSSGTPAFGSPAPAFGGASALGSKPSPWGTSQNSSSAAPVQSTPAFGNSSFGSGPSSSTPAFGQTSAIGFGQSAQLGAKSSPWGTSASAGGAAASGSPAFGQSGFANKGTFGSNTNTNGPAAPASGGFASFAGSSGFASAGASTNNGGSIFASNKPASGSPFASSTKADTAFPAPSTNSTSLFQKSEPFKLQSSFKPDPSQKDNDEKQPSSGSSLFGNGFGAALGDAAKQTSTSAQSTSQATPQASQTTRSPFSTAGTETQQPVKSPFGTANAEPQQPTKSLFSMSNNQTESAKSIFSLGSTQPSQSKSIFSTGSTQQKSQFSLGSTSPGETSKSPFSLGGEQKKSPFSLGEQKQSPFSLGGSTASQASKSPFSVGNGVKSGQQKNPFSIANSQSASQKSPAGREIDDVAEPPKSPFSPHELQSTTPTTTPAPNRFVPSETPATAPKSSIFAGFSSTTTSSSGSLFKTPQPSSSIFGSKPPQIKVEEDAPLPPESTSRNAYPIGDSSSGTNTDGSSKSVFKGDSAPLPPDFTSTPKSAQNRAPETSPLPADSTATPRPPPASSEQNGSEGSSDSSPVSSVEEDAPLPPDFISKATSRGPSTIPAVPEDGSDSDLEDDVESEGSGIIVGKDISPSSTGLTATPGAPGMASQLLGASQRDDFIAHTNAVPSAQETIPSQVEAVYRDINSMIDTLGLNARSLSAFIQGHRQNYKEGGRDKEDLEDADDWVLCELDELGEVIERDLTQDLEDSRVRDVEEKLEACQDLSKEMSRLRTKQGDLKKLIMIKVDPDQAEVSRSMPLSAEQASQQSELRRQYATFSKHLAEAEEALTLLKTKLASLNSASGKGGQKVPTVEAVLRTINKMTSMVEKRSGDIDVLENQMRKFRFASANSREGSPLTTPQKNNRSVMFSPDHLRSESPRNPRNSLMSSVMSSGGRSTTPRKKLSGFSSDEKSELMGKRAKRQAVLGKLKLSVQKNGVQQWPMPDDTE
ncbi:Nucleoporin like protein [Verticillium longisporum]|uniref:Nucleoporin like protein n=1 Tax=Verticillium longisporum TaxID=100787 RepID=A0A8I3APL3_VERLO|nr:Nucleoporin like protein [Verticillium longisporum]